jgi:putative DNA primase/helicase
LSPSQHSVGGELGSVIGDDQIGFAATGEPQAISRTFIDHRGQKRDRKFLGPVGGAAIKLGDDDEVTTGLHIGEGVETCLAARMTGLRPTWALGSAGAIAAFPVLSGVEALTIMAEPESPQAAETCAARWHEAGREVFIIRSLMGSDLNDALMASQGAHSNEQD